MKIFISLILSFVFLLVFAGSISDTDAWVRVQSNYSFAVTTDSTRSPYTIPTSGNYKYSIANDLTSDTILYKLQKGSTFFKGKIKANESYNRTEYLEAGTVFYIWAPTGSGGFVREEFFKEKK